MQPQVCLALLMWAQMEGRWKVKGWRDGEWRDGEMGSGGEDGFVSLVTSDLVNVH